MPSAPELKYTDRDVREDSSLKELAVDYVMHYGGEFDPLVRAQNMLALDGDLTTPMTRTVLNCMRNDERCAGRLPEPRGYTMPSRPLVKNEKKSEPRTLLLGGGYKYNQPYIYTFRLKFDFVINLHKQAKWYHKIDHSRTIAVYYPINWWEHPNTIELREVRGVCGKDLRGYWWRQMPHILLGDQIDAEDAGNEYCPRCLHGRRDAGWKP